MGVGTAPMPHKSSMRLEVVQSILKVEGKQGGGDDDDAYI